MGRKPRGLASTRVIWRKAFLERLGRHVAGQLICCGTASAPNYDEGCAAESRNDFAPKMSVATKEMRETRGWLRFIVFTNMQTGRKFASLLEECEQFLKMLSKSVLTAKRRSDLPPDHDSPQN